MFPTVAFMRAPRASLTKGQACVTVLGRFTANGESVSNTRHSDSGNRAHAEQRAAAQHGDGPLVVVAGAGTGKTRVITERIRYLLDTQPVLSGREILGLTFANKAAAEMKHRVIAAARKRSETDVERADAVTLAHS